MLARETLQRTGDKPAARPYQQESRATLPFVAKQLERHDKLAVRRGALTETPPRTGDKLAARPYQQESRATLPFVAKQLEQHDKPKAAYCGLKSGLDQLRFSSPSSSRPSLHQPDFPTQPKEV
jgi:hypothetical protein